MELGIADLRETLLNGVKEDTKFDLSSWAKDREKENQRRNWLTHIYQENDN